MRHITLDCIARQIGNKLDTTRPPVPMPGKRWPTRVAWHFEIHHRALVDRGTSNVRFQTLTTDTLSYIGKPARYRAIEAFNFLKRANPGQEASNPTTVLGQCWVAEFDREGLIAYRDRMDLEVTPAFLAYHPHSAKGDIINAFVKPIFVKFIGGMRLYSHKKKLTQEDVDAYYEWFHKTFKRKLRRPKAQATAVIGGEIVEA